MDVRLPNLGEGADSGVVVSLSVKEGETIRKGQALIELETGKAVAPIPSPADGRVTALRVKEGEKLSVGGVILVLDPVGSAAAPSAPAPAPASEKPARAARPSAAPAPAPAAVEPLEEGPLDLPAEPEVEDGTPIPASPEVRRIGRLLGIPLRKLKGSERGGRIVMEDLKAYISRLQRLALQPKALPQAPAPAPAAVAPSIDFAAFGPVTRKPMTSLRKVISQRMLESWTHIPQVTQFEEADITSLLELRKKHAAAYEKKGARLTVTSIVLKAVARTLEKHPLFNASIDDATQEVVLKQYIHLGIAVDTEAGLMVPVIRDAQSKSILQLSLDLQSLADKARERKVTMEDLRGGSFTISNQGGIGGGHFTPIVNRPEVAILGMGKGVLKPVVREKQVVSRTLLPLALSYDHRLIDGGSAARFVTDMVVAIESFSDADVQL
ncbi:MAG TPA: branched-chain alpha-keto acid dehydrogenase subunit E2 [Verrucomicrobiales bacterium]|nr:branched-chain alpha-keto acid dehydrogenase subunit E2 [Verrucomicrobiales bacterium]